MSSLALPEGWERVETRRHGGLYSGRVEVSYTSPCGKKIKSKAELAQFLGNIVDLTTFDFRTGKINANLLRKGRRSGRPGLYDIRNLKLDQTLTPPIRQNSGIFKKSVKIFSTQPNSSTYNWQQIKEYYKRNNMTLTVEPKLDSSEKPYQIFWQKRLQGLQPWTRLDEYADLQLPPNIKAYMASLSDNNSMLRSITAALHLGPVNIRGQEKNLLQKRKDPVEGERVVSPRNPGAFVNPQQPLIINTSVTEDDIRRQEEIVADARIKLTAAMQDLPFLKNHGIECL